MSIGWHVAQVSLGLEPHFANLLGDRAFCPLRRHRWTQRGRHREQLRALYTGCVFVRLDVLDGTDWHLVAAAKGFRSFMPGAALTEAVMDGERAKVGEDCVEHIAPPPTPHSFRIGEEITITTGPLAGHRAICRSEDDHERIFVETYLLGRQTRLYMPASWCAHGETAAASTLLEISLRKRRTGRKSLAMREKLKTR